MGSVYKYKDLDIQQLNVPLISEFVLFSAYTRTVTDLFFCCTQIVCDIVEVNLIIGT